MAILFIQIVKHLKEMFTTKGPMNGINKILMLANWNIFINSKEYKSHGC